jgi:hypothetical protein
VCTREATLFFFDLQSMLLVVENHVGAATSTHTNSKMLYTEGERPRGRGGRVSGCTIEATDKEGTKEMPIAVPDHPKATEVEVSLPWTTGIVTRKATGRASARRSAPSQGELRLDLDLDEPTKEIGRNCTTRKDTEKPEKPQPS